MLHVVRPSMRKDKKIYFTGSMSEIFRFPIRLSIHSCHQQRPACIELLFEKDHDDLQYVIGFRVLYIPKHWVDNSGSN